MSNPIDKLNEMRTYNEGIFGKMFGKKKEENQSVFRLVDRHTAMLGNSYITKFRGLSSGELEEYDWENGELSWLLDAKFKGELEFDRKNKTLLSFYGVWADGEFREGSFKSGPQAAFLKGNFYGDGFYASYESWKAPVENFMEGKLADGENGILGLPNITQQNFSRQTPVKEFDLIQIPPGYSMTIDTFDNNQFIVNCEKRMDRRNSMFAYTVINTKLNTKKRVRFEWNELRSEYSQKGTINIGSAKNISVLGIETKKGFSNISVGIAKFDYEPEVKAEKKDTSLPWSVLRGIGGNEISSKLKGVKNVKISLPAEDVTTYNQVIKNIENGTFIGDIQRIRAGIAAGVISGYAGFPLFRNIFNDRKGAPLAKTLKRDAKFYGAMERVHDFMEAVVNNMVLSTKKYGKSGISTRHDRAIELVAEKLQEILRVDNFKKFTIKGDSEKDKPEVAPTPLPRKIRKQPFSESVREEVKKILRDNF